jgi:hypothetical protein
MRRSLIALLLLCTPAVASAQRQPAAQPAANRPAPAASPYVQKVANGIRLLVARDFDGSIASLREAVALEGGNPMAHYYLGEAQRMKGELAEAVEAFRAAARHGAQGTEPRWQARAMQGVAETLERIPERLPEARIAWQEYVRFADAHRDVSFPELGRQRIQVIDTWTELELVVVDVRRRIEERERENAANAARPATPAPGGGR